MKKICSFCVLVILLLSSCDAFLPEVFTVTIDKNLNCEVYGGVFDSVDLIAGEDVEFHLPLLWSEHDEHRFSGYNTKADGSGEQFDAGFETVSISLKPTGNVQLYAQWSGEYDARHSIISSALHTSSIDTSLGADTIDFDLDVNLKKQYSTVTAVFKGKNEYGSTRDFIHSINTSDILINQTQTLSFSVPVEQYCGRDSIQLEKIRFLSASTGQYSQVYVDDVNISIEVANSYNEPVNGLIAKEVHFSQTTINTDVDTQTVIISIEYDSQILENVESSLVYLRLPNGVRRFSTGEVRVGNPYIFDHEINFYKLNTPLGNITLDEIVVERNLYETYYITKKIDDIPGYSIINNQAVINDVSPPEFVSLEVGATQITSYGKSYYPISMTLKDDHGVLGMYLFIEHIGAENYQVIDVFRSDSYISYVGLDTEGTFENIFARYTPSSGWSRIVRIDMYDHKGNRSSISQEQIEALGYTTKYFVD